MEELKAKYPGVVITEDGVRLTVELDGEVRSWAISDRQRDRVMRMADRWLERLVRMKERLAEIEERRHG